MFDVGGSVIGMKFLVIDNDQIFIALFREIVRMDFNAEVLIARDEEEAMNKACKEKPSLIVLNLFLSLDGIPGSLVEGVRRESLGELFVGDLGYSLGDGFRIASMLKNTKKTKNIPILALSTLDRSFVRAGLESAGCDGFIIKPFAINDLVSAMKNLMERSQGMVWDRDRKEIWRTIEIEG